MKRILNCGIHKFYKGILTSSQVTRLRIVSNLCEINSFYNRSSQRMFSSKDNNDTKENKDNKDSPSKENKDSKEKEGDNNTKDSSVKQTSSPKSTLNIMDSAAEPFPEIKIHKLTPEEEQSLEDFQSSPENPQSKSKVENFPLIHFTHPILPFSKVTINHPSKNDILFNMLIKYGQLNPVDEDTTIIEDVTMFFEKDDPFSFSLKNPKKEISPHVLGVLCKITYLNKEKLIIEGLDKIYKVKSLRSGKLKFFNPKETITIETGYNNNLEYYKDCLELLTHLVKNHEYISTALKLNENFFNEGNKTSFDFTFEDIKNKLQELSNADYSDNSAETSNSEDNLEEKIKTLVKFSYYFILKANTFSSHVYLGSNVASDIFKTLYLTDLKLKLDKTSEFFESLKNFINLKYDHYNFPQNLTFQTENPFAHENEEELLRINKYKEVIENKISEVDNVEKQKEEFKKKISEFKSMTEEVRKFLDKEINKISGVNLDQENGKRIEYLNHILNLPWDKYDEPQWDLDHAKKVLDSSLYGLNETKERIYEFIAKNMKKNNKKGCVILLTGGPGTGKTRIAKLIGEALKRKVGFVSLAGVSDGKSILGFKRTYVSSTPGMFIREMQHVGVKNPVIVVDEIDKVGFRNTHSNVYHALLQLLNTEENHRFQDHYLEIPFDFSNVVFILTSNNDEIFPPLIDRMEIIKVEPYVNYEKFLILKKYAKEQILRDYNFHLYGSKFQITDRAIYKLIFEYCKREAGVRKAKKLLESVIRKVNSKIELELKSKNKPESNVNTNINENTLNNESADSGLAEEADYLPSVLQINSNNVLKILNEPKEDDPVLTDMISNTFKRVGCCMGLFVSKTDQSNSWGSASIFSLSVKEIKDLSHSFKERDLFNEKDKISTGDIEVDNAVGNDISEAKEKNKNKNKTISSSLKEKKSKKKEKLSSKKDKKEDLRKNTFRISSSGNLGEDSLQSVDIALNFATEFLHEIAPEKADFFYKHQLHHDCPEILLPKSGPSAGIVIFLCAMSLALNKPLIPNLAMTGEICIDGSVLKIGGVKEKSQGAQQFGVKTLVIPIGNKYDFLDLPSNLKDSFERVFFVENCRQVYNIGFNLDTSDIESYVPEKCLYELSDYIEEEVLVQNNLAEKLFLNTRL